MKLRVQLTLAFLFLAVVPLTGISVYNYFSSIKAYRQAVEEEAGTLAMEMGGRMESMRADMNRRIGRLGSFPFRELMALNMRSGSPEESQALMSKLLSEMGDSAAYIDSLEFTPRAPLPPIPPSPAKPVAKTAPIVRRHSVPAAPSPDKIAALAMESARRMILHIPPTLQEPASPQTPETIRPLAANPEYRIVVEEIRKSAEALKNAVEAERKAGEAMRLAREKAGHEGAAAGAEKGLDVHMQEGPEGNVTARVRSAQLFRSVLSRGRRRPDDIPFAIDADGKVQTADPADQPKLSAMSLFPPESGVKTETRQAAQRDWVVVTRKEQGSNLTFGVARPIGEGLAQIRYTAVRNLGYGLAMVGLALIGILPLSGRMTRNLSVLTRGAEELAKGNLQVRVPVKTKDEFGRLAETFNRMVHDLGEHQKHLIEREKLQNELEMCRKIQAELLPRRPFKSGFVEAQGVSIPAREVGGDFFNYFAMPGDDVALLVGDVSGKGIAAALLMANFQATLEVRVPLGTDLAELARQLDGEVADNTPPEVYVTVLMAILDQKTGTLRYVNAGHHPQFALYADGTVERLESTGRPLGILPGGPYEEKTISLKPGDSLFFYTDGLVEAENAAGVPFGLERLQALLVEGRGGNADNVLSSIEHRLCEHRAGLESADDATMMVLKVGAVGSGA
jgi:serine phosphatase RsbU (regulator of sigma subunit)